MGHDKRHYPCQCKERVKIKTENGFTLNCKYCGHTFKEIKQQKTLSEDFFIKKDKK